jgi:hypothetical protein
LSDREQTRCAMTLDPLIVRNDVHEAICTLEDHRGPIAAIVLSVADHASSQLGDFVGWRITDRQHGIGKQRSIRADHPLAVAHLLHCAENRVKVGFHVPSVFVSAARKSEFLKNEEAVPELGPAAGTEIEPKELLVSCRPASGDLSVERCEPHLADLAFFRFKCILLGPESELYGAFVFGPSPNAMLHVISIQPKFVSIRYSPKGHVSVRVLSVRVDDRNPFEVAPDVCLDARHHFPDELLDVNVFPKLWRNN